MLKIGDIVPDFSLPGIDEKGEIRSIKLSDYSNKNVILYFYPKDDTQYCTIEACSFRDKLNIISKAKVIGISKDSIRSHMAFKNKHLINFALLSDTDNKVANLFGSWDNDSQLPLRHTFLINVDKKIIKEWREVDVANHADEVFDNL